MKRRFFIGLLSLLALAACVKGPEPDEGPGPTVMPSPALAAIDSLTWTRPDSALALLQDYFACRDVSRNVSEKTTQKPLGDVSLTHDSLGDVSGNASTREYDRHYANLLLAELRYKNYHPQANRTELRHAVAYFDSLVRQTPPLKGGRGDSRHALDQKGNLFFLSARAHYINGVGYYERDSIVEACREYLTALEIMGNHFKEKEIVGNKAKFLALAYTRLGELFSEQIMTEPAIECYKNTFFIYNATSSSTYGAVIALYRIGIQYDILGEKDSANYYYTKAIATLPDTANLLYRDLVSSLSLLGYQLEHKTTSALQRLKQMSALADDTDEQLTRLSTIGYIYFEEKQYDSALLYLEPVFEYKSNNPMRIQAAEYLCVIYDSLEITEKADTYIRFLAKNKPMVADAEAKVSQLNTLFQDYLEQKQEQKIMNEKAQERKMTIRGTAAVVAPILIILALLTIFALRKQYRKTLSEHENSAKQQLEAESIRHREALQQQQVETEKRLEEKDLLLTAHAAKAKAMEMQLERLKAANKTPKQQRTEAEQRRDTFLNEPICHSIIASVNTLHISARSQYGDFYKIALDEATGVALGNAVAKYFPNFAAQLASMSPKLNWKEMQTCYLYLLHLEDAQIAILLQCHHSTIYRRKERLQKAFGTSMYFPDFIRKTAFSLG